MEFSRSLKENHLFRRLYRKGQSSANGFLVLYYRRNGSKENRVGITASAKLGNAVKRNLIRRRLKAIYRIHEQEFVCGYDIIVVCRSRGISAPYADLETAYLALAKRMKLLKIEKAPF